MIPSIAEVVNQFKREWTKCLAPEAISELCRDAGVSWRERLLTPSVTIQLMLLQVLHGNTATGHSAHTLISDCFYSAVLTSSFA